MNKKPNDIIPKKMINANDNNKKLSNKKWISRILNIIVSFIFIVTIGILLLVYYMVEIYQIIQY